MYYNMTALIRILLIVFLFTNRTMRSKMNDLLNDFVKYMDDVFERRVGEIYNNRIYDDESEEIDEKEENEDDNKKDEKKEESKEEKKKEIKFEDKYLEKFKNFKNEYYFTEEEKLLESQKYDELKNEFNKDQELGLKETTTKLDRVQEVFYKGGITTAAGIEEITRYYNIEAEYEDDPDDYDMQELITELTEIRDELTHKYKEFSDMVFSEEEARVAAKQHVLSKKLDGFINNYIIEMTPLGNVYMRYNNDKKSFEYFSNNTIPYRYLEPVGRKYVITYFCKPLFIDIEEELKKAQQKKDDDKAKKDEEAKEKEDLILASGKTQSLNGKEKDKDIYTKMKSYNNESSTIAMMKGKNRQSNNTPLPPQIRANLPNVNSSVAPDKMLLKEHANRYTWEGRTANLPIVKKVEKKHVDKNYEMSFADFKKMRQKQ